MMRYVAAILLFITITGCVGPGPTQVYLLRHAEKQHGADPALTPAGLARANRLAVLLADRYVRHVYSTDYRRTRDTAAPIAARAGVEVQLYDPRQPEPIIERIRHSRGGVWVLVGHSNTVPDLVGRLGGDPGEPMTEQDYNRLYHLEIDQRGTQTTLLSSDP